MEQRLKSAFAHKPRDAVLAQFGSKPVGMNIPVDPLRGRTSEYSYVRDWFLARICIRSYAELVVFLIAPVDGSISCCADVL